MSTLRRGDLLKSQVKRSIAIQAARALAASVKDSPKSDDLTHALATAIDNLCDVCEDK